MADPAASQIVPEEKVVDVRVDRARLNYVKERLKDLREERERLLLERDYLRARLESAGYYASTGRNREAD